MPFEPCLVGLAAIGGVAPDIRGGVVAGHDIAEHPPIEPGRVGGRPAADETEHPADRDAALVAEARDRDVDTGPAIGYRQPSGLPGWACQAGSRRVGPARLDRILLSPGVVLPGHDHQRRIDDVPAHREIAAFPELVADIGQ